jgi:transcriptional regulator
MYCPNHFQESKHNEIVALISANPLATIVRNTENELVADHIPLFYENGKLIGHVAKANPLWQTPAQTEILVIFQGVNAYISPSWYATKQSTHKVVPTWNYSAVHIDGQLTPITDSQRNLEIVQKLTSIHEKT